MLVLGIIHPSKWPALIVIYGVFGLVGGILVAIAKNDGTAPNEDDLDARVVLKGVALGIWGALAEITVPASPAIPYLPSSPEHITNVVVQWVSQTFGILAPIVLMLLLVVAMGVTIFGGPAIFIGIVAVPIIILYHLPLTAQGLWIVLCRAFVEHPAEPVIDDALSTDTDIDVEALARALEIAPRVLTDPPPERVSRQHRARAEELKRRLDADRALIEAVIEREKARVKRPSVRRFWS